MVGLVLSTIVAAVRDKSGRPVAPAPVMEPEMDIGASDGFDEADPVDSFGTGDADFGAFDEDAFK